MRFLFLILTLVWATSSAAVEVENLYLSEVPVASQGSEDRNGAIRLALMEVLIKITGRRDIGNEALLKGLIKNGPRYVRQYRYLEGDGTGEKQQRKLRVRFDPFSLNDALEGLGFVIWPAERPSVLVWIAIESGKKRYLLELENYPNTTRIFQKAAEKRGLPLLLPLMDLIDQNSVSFNDIWGDFDDRIKQASRRYGTDAVLSGRLLKKTVSRWQAEWTLYQKGDVSHWRNEAGSVLDALATGIDGTFDLLAERYVINAAQKELALVSVRVIGIKGLDDFSWLTDQIESLPLVEAVEWSELDGENLLLKLTIKGDKEALHELLDSVDRLFFVEPGMDEIREGLLYQLQP